MRASTSMSEKNRSLASYFDDPHAQAPSWYDQTERLGGDLHSQGLSHTEDHGHYLSDHEEDGLDTPMLGSWMWHPDHKKQVWVPDGIWDVFAKPPDKTFQEKGDEDWKPNTWGMADHKRRFEHSTKPKVDRTGETKDQRAARMKATKAEREQRRKEKSVDITQARKTALDAFLRNPSWAATMVPVIQTVEAQKLVLTAQKNAKIAALKASADKMSGKQRDQALHSEVTNILVQGGQDWPAILQAVDAFCKANSLSNIVGTTLPTVNTGAKQGTHYLMVALDFLSQVKKQIMTGVLAILVKKIKGANPPKDRATYLFVNASYMANNLRNQLSKDRYPKKLKKYLDDTPAMLEWTKKVRKLEREAFKERHGRNAKIPKRLWDGPPPKGHQHGRVTRGPGGHPVYWMPMPMYQPNYGGRGGRRPNQRRHRGPKQHQYRPKYADDGSGEEETDQNNSPAYYARRGDYKLPGIQPPPVEPNYPYNIPYGYQMPEAASRMQRGYW